MLETFHRKSGKPMWVLHPGDFASSKDDMVLCTVLGSCIAVVLYDQRLEMGGMNHFMLPELTNKRAFFSDESGKYGMFAMELLINDMIKRGSRKENWVAKVFGGGHVLHGTGASGMVSRVPENNIEFAEAYLENEKIPIVSRDTGGNQGRKIYLYTTTGKVLLKRLESQLIKNVVAEEENYEKTIHQVPKKAEGPVFF